MKKLLLFPLFLSLAAHAEIGFTQNNGQFVTTEGDASTILFRSTGTGPGIFITTSGLTYVFHQKERSNDPDAKMPVNWSKIEMQLLGATIKAENVVTENALDGYSNYYYAHCPQGILKVKSWHKVTVKDVYPGIDWVLTADDVNGVAHDFIVHPGANPKQIRQFYKGVTNNNIKVDEQGRLVLRSACGTIYEGRLNVYEEATGEKLKASFVIKNQTQVSYELRLGKVSRTAIIDPPLQWAMPQASSNFDYGYATAAAGDATGDVLLTGATDGTDFPVLNGYQGTLYGFEDMVIQRLNSSGARVWSTYYGGTDYEQGKGIASDAAGDCYVTGNTGSSDFPVQNPTQVGYGNGVYDAAILKLNSAGVRLWATYYGALQNDYGTGIAVDALGTVYVTGYTNSSGFPTLTAHQATKAIGYDAFLIKLSTVGAVQWATFFGGDDDDKGRAITLDAAGANLFVTGTTLAGGFPITAGTFQLSNASAYNAEDAFILKMNTVTQAVGFATYCGGSDADFGQGIAVDNTTGNIYITGYTLSGNFPIANPGGVAYVDSTIGSLGTHDAFIVKCNSTGTTRLWATYFGGTMPDLSFSIAYDATIGLYICGNTASTDFPVQQPADNVYYQSTQGDGGTFNDMFIAWFGTNDSLRWSTYYGDANGNEAYGICTDASHNIFVTGVDHDELVELKFGPGITTGISAPAILYDRVLYPNPASQTLFIRFATVDQGDFTIELLDMQGRLVKHEEVTVVGNGYLLPLDVASLANGVYTARITSANDEQNIRFVKE